MSSQDSASGQFCASHLGLARCDPPNYERWVLGVAIGLPIASLLLIAAAVLLIRRRKSDARDLTRVDAEIARREAQPRYSETRKTVSTSGASQRPTPQLRSLSNEAVSIRRSPFSMPDISSSAAPSQKRLSTNVQRESPLAEVDAATKAEARPQPPTLSFNPPSRSTSLRLSQSETTDGMSIEQHMSNERSRDPFDEAAASAANASASPPAPVAQEASPPGQSILEAGQGNSEDAQDIREHAHCLADPGSSKDQLVEKYPETVTQEGHASVETDYECQRQGGVSTREQTAEK